MKAHEFPYMYVAMVVALVGIALGRCPSGTPDASSIINNPMVNGVIMAHSDVILSTTCRRNRLQLRGLLVVYSD